MIQHNYFKYHLLLNFEKVSNFSSNVRDLEFSSTSCKKQFAFHEVRTREPQVFKSFIVKIRSSENYYLFMHVADGYDN